MSLYRSTLPSMDSASSFHDQIQYRYRPWAATCGTPITDLRRDSLVSTHSVNHPVNNPVLEDCGQFPGLLANEQQPSSQAGSLPFVFDTTSDTVPSSPKARRVQHLGDSWQSYPSCCSPSPSDSPYSSCDGRAWGDAQNTSWASPHIVTSFKSHPSLGPCFIDDTNATLPPGMIPSSSCISLSDVQQFEEPEPDLFVLDSNNTHEFPLGGGAYTYSASTFLQPQITVEAAENFFPESYPLDANLFPRETAQVFEARSPSQSDSTYSSSASTLTDKKRARKHSQSVSSVAFSPSKIVKRKASTTPRRLSAPIEVSPSRISRTLSASQSSFPCVLAPYGCCSGFGSKNEWKRHVNTQHLRLDLWRCDQCSDRDTRPNDFNRKDLFIQHLRRMHYKSSDGDVPQRSRSSTSVTKTSKSKIQNAEEMDPAIVAAEQRCHIRLRRPPFSSSCLFCSVEFEGQGSWEERMEHIGRHLEQDKKDGIEPRLPLEWRHDETVETWLETEGLISRVGHQWQIADGRRSNHRH